MRETRSSGSVEGVVGNHDPYSDFLPRFSRGIKEASDSLLARPRAVFLWGSQDTSVLRFARHSSLVTCHSSLPYSFLGEPQTRRVSVSGRTKQKPAVPPARRRFSHLAVPARRRGVRKGK
jgi:hypothetical protein